MRKIELLIWGCVIGFVITIVVSNINLKSENKSLSNNVDALIKGVEQYEVEDSLQAATIANLELSLSQYKKYREEDNKLLESLKIDNKRLKEVIKTQTKTYYEQTTLLRDSIIMLSGSDSIFIPVYIKTAEYSDKWHSLNVVIHGDSLNYKLRTTESLLITNHVVPKRFLFIKYGCTEVRTDIVSRNPYVEDIQVESITIK